MDQNYNDFLDLVPNELKGFVDGLNSYLLEKKCKRTIKPASKGYLVSYALLKAESRYSIMFLEVGVLRREYMHHM